MKILRLTAFGKFLEVSLDLKFRVESEDHHKKKSIAVKYVLLWASQVMLVVKKPTANMDRRKRLVRSLGWEDPLEEGMANHSSILAWIIPWTEEPGGCGPEGHTEPDTTEAT